MITTTEIEKMILKSMPGSKVSVSDMTGTGDHFEIQVVSNKFEGLSIIDQHKLVHAALKGEMDNRIHAVKLKTKTP